MSDHNRVRFLAVSLPTPKNAAADDAGKIQMIKNIFPVESRPEIYKFGIPDLEVTQLGRLFEQTSELDKLARRANAAVERIGAANISLYDDDESETRRVQLEQGEKFNAAVVGFAWDTNMLPVRQSLDELAATLSKKIGVISDETAAQFHAYRQARTELQNFSRTMRSNLSTRPLELVVQPHHTIFKKTENTEYLEPVLVVVPNNQSKGFMHFLGADPEVGPIVAPDTVDVIATEPESTMYVVVVFRPRLALFQAQCQAAGFVVRSYVADEKRESEVKDAKELLARKVQDEWGHCLRFGAAAFDDAVRLWCHAVGLVMFVESALRYGLKLGSTACFIRINEKNCDGVAAALHTAFRRLGDPSSLRNKAGEGSDLADDFAELSLPGNMIDPDYTPYVSVKMDGPATLSRTGS